MLAIIRIRGDTGVKEDINRTAELLRLNRINHLVLVDDNAVTRGMLQKVKDYVTWGEIDSDTLEILLKELKEKTGFSSYREMSDALMEGKIKFKDIKDVVPVIRLNPPYRGYEAIKIPYNAKGSSGYRGKAINNLIRRMIIPGSDLNGKHEN